MCCRLRQPWGHQLSIHRPPKLSIGCLCLPDLLSIHPPTNRREGQTDRPMCSFMPTLSSLQTRTSSFPTGSWTQWASPNISHSLGHCLPPLLPSPLRSFHVPVSSPLVCHRGLEKTSHTLDSLSGGGRQPFCSLSAPSPPPAPSPAPSSSTFSSSLLGMDQ